MTTSLQQPLAVLQCYGLLACDAGLCLILSEFNSVNVRHSTVQYSTVQYSTVQCSAVQYSTVQYSAVQCSAVQCSTVQYSTVSKLEKLDVLGFFFLLTMHLSIFILVINQLDAQNLFYNKFLSCLHMFRAPCAHRQAATYRV